MAESSLLSALHDIRDRSRSWFADDPLATVKLVVAVTLLGLVLRVAALGSRVAHFDEGRVAYWALNLRDSGSFAYRYIIHGPFIQHVDSWVFTVAAPTDFTMRLPVAIVGGLLPLTALLFREHLRSDETVLTAAFLALNPVLLYFSRFMRSDVLVAAFMFTAFGLLVRFVDTRKPRYLYGVGAFMALGFASKENAIVYVLTWLGATGLLLAKVLVLPNGYRDAAGFLRSVPSAGAIWGRLRGRFWADIRRVRDIGRSFRDRHDSAASVLAAYASHIVLATLVFAFVSLFFYAPRGAGVAGIEHPPAPAASGDVNFWSGVTNLSLFPELVQTTWERVVDQYTEWFSPASEKATTTDTGLIESIETFYESVDGHYEVLLKALGYAAAPLLLFSAFGYALDRLGTVEPRHLIPFLAYGGYVSILGYPIGTDIGAPWLAVHVVVPLSVPAAVGLAAVVRWGSESLSAEDVTGVAIAATILLLVTALVGNTAATQVYANEHLEGNPLVQYAQPQESLRADLAEMDRIATAHGNGTDVVMYHGESGDAYDGGDAYVKEDRDEWNDSWWDTRPTCLQWHNSLPLPWYFAADDVNVTCENRPGVLVEQAQAGQPPILITQQVDSTVPTQRLEDAGYEPRTHRMRTKYSSNDMTVWVHESYGRETNA
ncbi:flippase activity-associated protein Agl23 [Haloarcula mannanilytica]|uniref:flippase activity-associated protein Agl23 n=1 Tax=Haloarcula mannanilytica TaxID=2509225 RepID=UPI0010F52E3D|nr:flippase activity-associated protein Agl23 [Haloarcula mannanilytica]